MVSNSCQDCLMLRSEVLGLRNALEKWFGDIVVRFDRQDRLLAGLIDACQPFADEPSFNGVAPKKEFSIPLDINTKSKDTATAELKSLLNSSKLQKPSIPRTVVPMNPANGGSSRRKRRNPQSLYKSDHNGNITTAHLAEMLNADLLSPFSPIAATTMNSTTCNADATDNVMAACSPSAPKPKTFQNFSQYGMQGGRIASDGSIAIPNGDLQDDSSFDLYSYSPKSEMSNEYANGAAKYFNALNEFTAALANNNNNNNTPSGGGAPTKRFSDAGELQELRAWMRYNEHNEKPFQCVTCGLEIRNRSNFFKHVRTMHLGWRFRCPFCSHTSTNRHDVASHAVRRHGQIVDRNELERVQLIDAIQYPDGHSKHVPVTVKSEPTPANAANINEFIDSLVAMGDSGVGGDADIDEEFSISDDLATMVPVSGY